MSSLVLVIFFLGAAIGQMRFVRSQRQRLVYVRVEARFAL